jgi:hypothetical protein
MDKKEKAIVYTAISVWLVWAVSLFLYAHYILKV